MKKLEFLTNKTHRNSPRINYFLILIVMLMSISLVSAANFDNTYNFDKNIGKYGKYEIKNWFGLQNFKEIELKSNTEKCLYNNCESVKEIIMHTDGILIDSVRYFDLRTGSLTQIKSSKFYILQGNEKTPYVLGTEVSKGTYQLIHEGELFNFQKVDWQIEIDYGVWSEAWAVWTSGLNIGLTDYFDFDETGAVNGTQNQVRITNNLTSNNNTATKWVTGILSNAYNGSGGDIDRVQNMTNIKSAILNLSAEGNWSLSVWIFPTATSGVGMGLFQTHTDTHPSTNANFITGSNIQIVMSNDSNQNINKVSTDDLTLNAWHQLIFVWNGSGTNGNIANLLMYINGTLQTTVNTGTQLGNYTESANVFQVGRKTSSIWFGGIDELGIWNKALTTAEITQLYNAGAGIVFVGAPTVTLNSPVDNLQSLNKTIDFNYTTEISGTTLKNATFFHNQTGIWHRNLTANLSGTLNSTIFTQTFIKGNFLWNVEVCASNDICAFASNKTASIIDVKINSDTYSTSTVEGSLDLFELNVTLITGLQISNANLIYNDTVNIGTISNTGESNYSLSINHEAPNIVDITNLSFYWNLVLSDSSEYNTTIRNQTVNNLTLDDCSIGNVLLLNYTINDENTQKLLEVVSNNSNIEIDLQIYTIGNRGTPIINFSGNYSKNSNPQVCLDNTLSSSSYEMDVQTFYEGTEYSKEYHYLQNTTLINSTMPINIKLYNLLLVNAQEFKITYKDENFLVVKDALIQIQRKYISDGVFRTVEQPKTDAQGAVTGHLEVNGPTYTIIVTKNGATLATFNNIVPVCQNPSIETCEINLNSFASSISPNDYTIGDDFTFTLTVNKTSRTFETIFSVPSGVAASVLLNVSKLDNKQGTIGCSNSLISSSGTLNCIVPISVGNGTMVVTITKAGVIVGQAFTQLDIAAKDLYGSNVVFLGVFLLLTLIGVGIGDDPRITGVFMLIGAVLLIALNLINTGQSAWVGAGATFLWLAIAIILIFIKGEKRR
jgi:hypothetical protein